MPAKPVGGCEPEWEWAVDSQAGVLEVPQASEAGQANFMQPVLTGHTVCSIGPWPASYFARHCPMGILNCSAHMTGGTDMPSDALHDVVG